MRPELAIWLVIAMPIPASAQVPDSPPIVNKSLSLADALALAEANNPLLKQSQADANTAGAGVLSARSQREPILSATTYGAYGDSANVLTSAPGAAPQDILPVAARGFADQNLTLMAPLFTGGKAADAIAAASRQEEDAILSVNAQKNALVETVTEAYVTVALQQALVTAAQSRLSAEEEQVRESQTMVAAGRIAPVDLLREQAEQADAQGSLLAAQNQSALALLDLKQAVGISQASEISVSDTLDTLAGLRGAVPSPAEAIVLAESRRME